MESFDRFDNFDVFSRIEKQHKLKGLKHNYIHRFFEENIAKFYEIYKKNRKSDINLKDYKIQFLKDYLRKKRDYKKNMSFCSISKLNFSNLNLNDEECKY